MKEVWKDIKDYEGLYKVSNFGNIKSLKNKKILIPWVHNKYLYISLCKNGKDKHFLVHRLVAQTFIPNPNNLPQVNHKDEIPSNNRVDNLEWCSSKYNANYGTRNERNSKKVICLENGIIFENTYKAGEYVNSDCGQISLCCNLKGRKTVKGLHFCYLDNMRTIEEIENSRIKSHTRKVRCIETNEVFNSIVEAQRKYNIKNRAIYSCLCGKQKTAKNLHWEYIKE